MTLASRAPRLAHSSAAAAGPVGRAFSVDHLHLTLSIYLPHITHLLLTSALFLIKSDKPHMAPNRSLECEYNDEIYTFILHEREMAQSSYLDTCRAASLSCRDLAVRVARLLFLLASSTAATRPLREA